ncbi:FAD-dependent oxidoreductase-like protein [Rhynchospora pubera]|uniref:FAD-dependent oxidoreductase-like protein n=1 Tax=Rhynchospora pubera TaxID=906938 RepID=A0AAV8HG02_9POAL|nr:FAD-dependent oxidoreductase-like protein [Rhynchospora pubera]
MAPALEPLTATGLLSSRLNPLQNPNPLNPIFVGALSRRRKRGNRNGGGSRCNVLCTATSPRTMSSTRYAILGAGFAGLSVAWHLLKHTQKGSHVCVDIFDETGIGGGASGVAGGLLHPYSPKAKLLWKGAEFWKECLELLAVAEQANNAQRIKETDCVDGGIVLRRGILRPATSQKNVEILIENASSCLESCILQTLDEKAAQFLIPGLCAPFDLAIYMPGAVSIQPKRYLQALFSACQNLANDQSKSTGKERIINLRTQYVSNLHQLSESHANHRPTRSSQFVVSEPSLDNFTGEYDSVIVCLGARVNTLPELSGKLPLRTCRGIVSELHLPTASRGEYADQSPSILSDAWLAFQGPRQVYMGSTWDWNSKIYDQNVSKEECARATEELISRASIFYPEIRRWSLVGAKAGLRAMPPLTENGSVPLLGCLNDLIGDRTNCMFWLVGGLGARGLLYHGLVGKLTSQAAISCDESVIPFEFIDWKKRMPCIVS